MSDNNDNTNNNNPNDILNSIRKRRRNIPSREWAKRLIHRMIVSEGLGNKEVAAHLNLPIRTVERYISEIYHHDNLVLISPTIDDVMTAANVFKDRLTKQRRDVLNGIANNPDIDPDARVQAHNLVAEMDRAIYNLSYEIPAALARKLNLSSAAQLIEKQKGLNIKVVKINNINSRGELPNHSGRSDGNNNVIS